jgi:hypothetical protein
VRWAEHGRAEPGGAAGSRDQLFADIDTIGPGDRVFLDLAPVLAADRSG